MEKEIVKCPNCDEMYKKGHREGIDVGMAIIFGSIVPVLIVAAIALEYPGIPAWMAITIISFFFVPTFLFVRLKKIQTKEQKIKIIVYVVIGALLAILNAFLFFKDLSL